MKRYLTFIIFLLLSSLVFAQQNEAFKAEATCAHARPNNGHTLDHLYNWQSKFLDDYDVTFYFLDIEVSSSSTFVSGNVTIEAIATQDLDTLAFELVSAHTIDSIFYNDELYTEYIRQQDNILVPVKKTTAYTPIKFKVYYHGDPGDTGVLSGLSKAYNEKYSKHVAWSLSEPFGAKSWFPVKQDLEDKADSCWVFLTTSKENKAGAQGLLTNTVELEDEKIRYEWKSRYPIVYYLISFAVSDYMEYNIYAHPEEMDGDSILIQNYVYNDPQCLEDHKWGIDNTVEMLELFSDLFTLYPFHEEKYGHCLTQLGGGMEHQTMSTMGGFSFGLVAHELGHMWFGDNVTCATWSDIWINEGFATYSNYLAEEYIHGWEKGKDFIRSKQDHVMTQPGGSVFIPEAQITQDNQWRIFNGRLSYDKGAVILHMLRHEFKSDNEFYDVLRTFQVKFRDSTATGEDFREVAEEVTGMDLYQFFEQWYYGQGFPIYDIKYYMDEDNLHMIVTQSASTTATLKFDMLMDYKIIFADGTDTVVQLRQTDNLNSFSVYVGKDVTGIEVDPEDWTLERVGDITSVKEDKELPVYFTLGPNPVNQSLHLFFMYPTTLTRGIEILDLSGKLIFQAATGDDRVTIDTGKLSRGIYLVKVDDGQHQYARRFVK
jgi:aminopeptidase N